MKLLFFLALVVVARAQTSADYALTSVAFGDAGGPGASAAYAQIAVTGGMPGQSQSGSAEANLGGFIARLFDPVTLLFTPSPAEVAEGSELQLVATLRCDDDSTLKPSPVEIDWSVDGGALAAIAADGMLTVGQVYADSIVRVTGSYGSLTSSLLVTIHNRGEDDFGIYANDGINDAWQVGYFGADNPLGNASADPDGDGCNNLLEFLSGYSPVDSAEHLAWRVVSLHGAKCQLEISKVQAGTVYEIESSTDLRDWMKLGDITPDATSAPYEVWVESPDSMAFFRLSLGQAR